MISQSQIVNLVVECALSSEAKPESYLSDPDWICQRLNEAMDSAEHDGELLRCVSDRWSQERMVALVQRRIRKALAED